MFFLFLALFGVVVSDALWLKSKLPERYDRIMQIPPLRWAFYVLLVCPAMLPIYLLRRRRLLNEGIELDENGIRLTDALSVLLNWFCGVMVVVIIAKFIGFADPSFRGSLLAVLLVSGFSSFFLVWLMVKVSRSPGRMPFATSVALHKPHKPALKTYAVAILLGILFAAVSAYILQSRAQTPSTPLAEALEDNESALAMGLFVLLGLGAAPFLEEVIFRGYFFGVLQAFRGQAAAVVLIAGLFAFLHVGQYWGDWLAIVMVTLLGLEITLLRAWSGSVIPGMVTHYCYNTLVSVLPFVFFALSNPAFAKYATEYPHLTSDQKQELLLKSIQARPDFAESYNDLAWLYAEQKIRLPEALELIQKALAHDPDNVAFLDTKAEILYQLGRTSEAIDIARALVRRRPTSVYYQDQLRKFLGQPITTPPEKSHNPHRSPLP